MKSLTSPLRVSKCYFGSKTSSGSSTQRPSETYFMRFVGLSPHHSPRLLRTMPVNRPQLRHCHKISVQQMLTWQKINFLHQNKNVPKKDKFGGWVDTDGVLWASFNPAASATALICSLFTVEPLFAPKVNSEYSSGVWTLLSTLPRVEIMWVLFILCRTCHHSSISNSDLLPSRKYKRRSLRFTVVSDRWLHRFQMQHCTIV